LQIVLIKRHYLADEPNKSLDEAAVNKAGVKQIVNWGVHPDYLG
jgi:hypothetical protein